MRSTNTTLHRKAKGTLLLVIGILIGVVAHAAFPSLAAATPGLWETGPLSSGDNAGWSDETPDYLSGLAAGLTGVTGAPERASPKDRIPESAIAVYGDRVVLDLQDAQWSTFTDTNSMDPVLDQGANAIQVVPKSADEIDVGDIISYKSEYGDGESVTIHRVVYKGEDEQGTYFVAKGDNLQTSDPGKIRFSQILRVVVAIVY